MKRERGRLFRRNKIWYLEWFVQGKRFCKSLRTTSRREAERKRREMLGILEIRDHAVMIRAMQAAADEMTRREERARSVGESVEIADAWNRFRYDERRRGALGRLGKRTVEDYRQCWERFARWAAERGMERMGEVSRELAEGFARELLEELSPQRRNRIVRVCRVMFERAGFGDRNPFAGIRQAAVMSIEDLGMDVDEAGEDGDEEAAEGKEAAAGAGGRVNLSRDEALVVLEAAEGELRVLVGLGIFTGMRLGDCCLLRWDDVHLEEGRIVRRLRKSRRWVGFPIHGTLRQLLEGARGWERDGWVLPGLAGLYRRDASGVTKRVRDLFEGCGLVTRRSRGKGRRAASIRGFHSLRHMFVTECARAGVPEGAIREWIGHSSVMVTRIYEHWQPTDAQRKILEALPAPRRPDDEERDRERLRRLATSAPIGVVRRMLRAAGKISG